MELNELQRQIELRKSVREILPIADEAMLKARGHKYIRKEGTGDTAKYFYRVDGKVVEGTKSGPKLSHAGEDLGHHIGDKVKNQYGETLTVSGKNQHGQVTVKEDKTPYHPSKLYKIEDKKEESKEKAINQVEWDDIPYATQQRIGRLEKQFEETKDKSIRKKIDEIESRYLKPVKEKNDTKDEKAKTYGSYLHKPIDNPKDYPMGDDLYGEEKEDFEPVRDALLDKTLTIKKVTVDDEWTDDHESCFGYTLTMSNGKKIQIGDWWSSGRDAYKAEAGDKSAIKSIHSRILRRMKEAKKDYSKTGQHMMDEAGKGKVD